MNENLHNIDRLFKDAIEQHDESPSPEVWDAIDKTLDKNKVVSISRKYNKLKWAAAALVLFSAAMALYTWHTRVKDKELVKQNKLNKTIKENKPVVIGNDKTQPANSRTTQTPTDNLKITTVKTEQNKSTVSTEKDQGSTNKNLNKNIPQKSEVILSSDVADQTGRKPGHQIRQKTLFEQSNITQPGNKLISAGSDKDHHAVSKIVNDQGSTSKNELNNMPAEKYFAEIPIISQLQISPINKVLPNHEELAPKNSTINDNNNFAINDTKSTSAGNNKIKAGKNSALSATVFFSPNFIFDDVRNDHPQFREDDRNEIKNDEKTRSSNTFGFLLDYTISKKWRLESGLAIFTKITDLDGKTVYARPDNNGNVSYRLNCSAGAASISLKSGTSPSAGDSAQALSAKNTLQYLSIPVAVKYTFGKGKISFTAGAGISANILSKGKIETVIAKSGSTENTSSNDIQGLKSNFFSSLFSIGAQYKLSKTFSLNLMPSANFALSSINKDAPVKTSLNSIGLAGALSIKF